MRPDSTIGYVTISDVRLVGSTGYEWIVDCPARGRPGARVRLYVPRHQCAPDVKVTRDQAFDLAVRRAWVEPTDAEFT